MTDFLGLMKQAGQLQAKMAEMQAELDQVTVEGAAGGGMVSVTMSAKGDLKGVRIEDGKLEIALEQTARKTLVNDLSRKISEWTGRRWMVVLSSEQGAPTVNSQNAAKQSELEQGVRADPLVQAVLARFPGAEIVGVRRRDDLSAPEAPAAGEGPMPNPDDYGADDDDR